MLNAVGCIVFAVIFFAAGGLTAGAVLLAAAFICATIAEQRGKLSKEIKQGKP